MKKIITLTALVIIIFSAGFMFLTKNTEVNKEQIAIEYNFSKEFKNYWLAGKAELSSYELSKARYGEIHSGEAVLVFVVEPFLPIEQVKSDGFPSDEKSERVMKLINSQHFYTGIYPYSIMTSSFYPLNKNRNGVLKISMSSQDWCGQVYSQINDRDDYFEVRRYSYFQNEGDEKLNLEKGLTEEELFTKARLEPKNLPVGKLSLYPSVEYFRLTHTEIDMYSAEASLIKNEEESLYKIEYKNIDRELIIRFANDFPHYILGWEETYSDFSGKRLTSTAQLKKSIQLDYWQFNSAKDSTYRQLLALK
ncbi:MAG: hypothetical protein U5K00_15355 [Melioribacteraceae bacterium]|nr:hypothetical protein [Melioribacteraceae bacterium]